MEQLAVTVYEEHVFSLESDWNETFKSGGDLMIPVELVSAGPSGHTSHSQSSSQQ